jgi:hypothetical protein
VNSSDPLVRRHLAFGWSALLFFLLVGLVLETFHGFKVGWYLNVTSEARRFMLTLGHAHGALLGLINILFGLSIASAGVAQKSWAGTASLAMILATVLLPGGFLLAGFFTWGADPGLGVFLAPVGAVALIVAVASLALRLRGPSS